MNIYSIGTSALIVFLLVTNSILLILAGCPTGGPSPSTTGTGTTITMFITSNNYGTTTLGGRSGADSTCQGRASAASLPNPSSYVAFLCTSALNAKDDSRIPSSAAIINTAGKCIAANLNDLLQPAHTITATNVWFYENGGSVASNSGVATGCLNDGSVNSGYTCNDWSSGGSSYAYGIFPYSEYAGGQWLYFSTTPCTGARLFCISTTAAGVTGDPQFVGLYGQKYQIHGEPNRMFSILSIPHITSFNSLFSFLSASTHSLSKLRLAHRSSQLFHLLPQTVCRTHAGTYLTKIVIHLGVNSISNNDNKQIDRIEIKAGSYLKGMHISINNNRIKYSIGPGSTRNKIKIFELNSCNHKEIKDFLESSQRTKNIMNGVVMKSLTDKSMCNNGNGAMNKYCRCIVSLRSPFEIEIETYWIRTRIVNSDHHLNIELVELNNEFIDEWINVHNNNNRTESVSGLLGSSYDRSWKGFTSSEQIDSFIVTTDNQ